MTVSNIGIGSVFSHPFGKSAQAIMKEVLESDIIEDEKILKCIHGSCKNKDKILDSIKHCNIETDQRFKMNESMTHMEELQVHINNCEIEIMKRAKTNVRSIHAHHPTTRYQHFICNPYYFRNRSRYETIRIR